MKKLDKKFEKIILEKIKNGNPIRIEGPYTSMEYHLFYDKFTIVYHTGINGTIVDSKTGKAITIDEEKEAEIRIQLEINEFEIPVSKKTKVKIFKTVKALFDKKEDISKKSNELTINSLKRNFINNYN